MKKYNSSILLFICSALIVSCGAHSDEKSTAQEDSNNNILVLTDAQLSSVGITVDTLQQRSTSRELHLTGQVKVPPQHVYSMSAPLGGYVASITLVPGTRVKKGQLVVTMEDVQYIELQQQFLAAKSRMTMLEAEYSRQRTLNESKASSDRELQQAKAEWEAATVELRALREKLSLIHIDSDKLTSASISKTISLHAPFDGFVSKVNVNAGKYVTSSEVMVEFIQSENCYLGLTVFEKDMRELTPGMKLFSYGNNANDTILCEIDFVNPDLTDQHTGEAICRFTSAHSELIPGMFMQADAELGVQQTAAMPAESVVHFENKNYLFAQNDAHTFEMIEVNAGTEEDGFISVTLLSPLNGRRVVYKGAYALLMAMKNEAE